MDTIERGGSAMIVFGISKGYGGGQISRIFGHEGGAPEAYELLSKISRIEI